MDMLLQGFAGIMTPSILLALVLGTVVGIIIGALPGLTATMGVALLLPMTFGMQPAVGLLLLVGVYFGGVYGGSITAILLKTPGTPAAAATAMDGYALTQKGQAGKALTMAITSSTIGGILSVFVLMFLAPQLADVALKFSAPETFALAFFGLSIIASISGKNLLKGLIAGFAGLLLCTIGVDPIGGFPRFTGGIPDLMNGVAFIPVMIGLFAASEAFRTLETLFSTEKVTAQVKNSFLTGKEIVRSIPNWLRSAFLGIGIGIIPGAGADIAAFVSYNEAKRWSKHKNEFGTGRIEGVAACESAANGATGGAMVPLLTLGIPGDAVTAVMLGALMVQGLQPGPMLFKDNAGLVWTLFAGMLAAYVIMFILGIFFSRMFAKVALIPKGILAPVILVLCVVGSYAINNNYVDVIVMFVSGLIGYGLQRYDYPVSPIILALILGPMAEGAFRRSLVMSQGSYEIFFTRPITLTLLVISVATLVVPILLNLFKKTKDRQKPATTA